MEPAPTAEPHAASVSKGLDERVAALEATVKKLTAELQQLSKQRAGHAADKHPTTQPISDPPAAASWSVAQVAEWIKGSGIAGADEIAEKITQEKIDGGVLTAYTGQAHLKEDLGLTSDKANKMWKAIQALVTEGPVSTATSDSTSAAQGIERESVRVEEPPLDEDRSEPAMEPDTDFESNEGRIRGDPYCWAEELLEGSVYAYMYSKSSAEKGMAHFIHLMQILLLVGITMSTTDDLPDLTGQDPTTMYWLLVSAMMLTIMYLKKELRLKKDLHPGVWLMSVDGFEEELFEAHASDSFMPEISTWRREGVDKESLDKATLQKLQPMFEDELRQYDSLMSEYVLFCKCTNIRVVVNLYATYRVMIYESASPMDYFMNCLAVTFVNDLDELIGSIAQAVYASGKPKPFMDLVKEPGMICMIKRGPKWCYAKLVEKHGKQWKVQYKDGQQALVDHLELRTLNPNPTESSPSTDLLNVMLVSWLYANLVAQYASGFYVFDSVHYWLNGESNPTQAVGFQVNNQSGETLVCDGEDCRPLTRFESVPAGGIPGSAAGDNDLIEEQQFGFYGDEMVDFELFATFILVCGLCGLCCLMICINTGGIELCMRCLVCASTDDEGVDSKAAGESHEDLEPEEQTGLMTADYEDSVSGPESEPAK